MLQTRGIELKGKKVLISGAGNVAQYAAEKCLQLGAIPMTMSDSDGYIYDPDGITREKLDYIMQLKNVERGRTNVTTTLETNLKKAHEDKPLSLLPQIWTDFKKDELANIYKGKGTQKEKESVYDVLFGINASQNATWEKIKN
jgi:hypothetical protein